MASYNTVLLPEKPYLPVQGINPDAAGLSVSPEEAAETLNLRVFPRELRTRGGDKRLAIGIPGGDPILHYHSFKAPGAAEVLFGYTKNNVYEYSVAGGTWTPVYGDVTVLSTCESTSGWTQATVSGFVKTLNTVAESIQGSASIHASYRASVGPDTLPDATIFLTLDLSAAPVDTSAGNRISFWAFLVDNFTPTNTRDFKIRFSKGATVIDTLDFTVTPTATKPYDFFTEVSVVKTDSTDTDWATVTKIEVLTDGALATKTISLYLDYIISNSKLAADVEFWHTTDFIDGTEGSTVVAAGSNPPKANGAEDDGTSRVLLYYDVSEGYFTDLSITKRVLSSGEDSTKLGPAAAGVVTGNCDNIGVDDSLLAGSLSIYTAEDGTLATSSAIVDSGGADKYVLIPVEGMKIVDGTSSYIEEDGDWSIEFEDGTYNGKKIYVAYTRSTPCGYMPRYVWNFHNRLILANTFETPNYNTWRVRCTNLGVITVLTDTNYWDVIDNDVTPITGGDYQGYNLMIYKQRSLAKVSYVGGTLLYSIDTVWKSGTYAGQTLQTFRGRQFFLGEDDVYMWDGASAISITRPLREWSTQERTSGDHRVRDKIFTTINMNKLENCFGSIYEKYQEYWLWIVKRGETYPSSVFVYSTLRDIWYYFEFTNVVTTGYFYVDTQDTYASLVGTYADQNWRYGEGTLEGVTRSVVLAYATGDSYIVDDTTATDGGYTDESGTWVPGTAVATRLITRDFIFSDLPAQDRVQRMDFEAAGSSVDVSVSNHYENNPDNFIQLQTITLIPTQKESHYFPDVVGEHTRFCMESNGYFSLRWLTPYGIREDLMNE